MKFDPKVYPLLILPFTPIIAMIGTILLGSRWSLLSSLLFWLYLSTTLLTAALLTIYGLMGAAFSRESHRRQETDLEPEILALLICGLVLGISGLFLAYLRLGQQDLQLHSWTYWFTGAMSAICGLLVLKRMW